MGCKVIAIAGSEEKCRWLETELGATKAINCQSTFFPLFSHLSESTLMHEFSLPDKDKDFQAQFDEHVGTLVCFPLLFVPPRLDCFLRPAAS